MQRVRPKAQVFPLDRGRADRVDSTGSSPPSRQEYPLQSRRRSARNNQKKSSTGQDQAYDLRMLQVGEKGAAL